MVSNNDIVNQIKRNLFYFKLQKDIIDAKNTRSKNNSLRNKWLQSQKVKKLSRRIYEITRCF